MIHLVRFDSILDAYTRKTFEGLDGGFFKNSVGEYVCGKDIFGSESFGEGLEKKALSLAGGFDVFSLDYYFILGDCRPAENILLELDGIRYTGKKSRYRLAEQDISIDTRSFNRRAAFVFSRLFRRKACMPKNMFAISHMRLGAGTLRAFMTAAFGKTNCLDMDSDVLGGHRRCILNVNDEIERTVCDKSRLNRTEDAFKIMRSLKQYIAECTGMEWSV